MYLWRSFPLLQSQQDPKTTQNFEMDNLGKFNSSWFLISRPDVESFMFLLVFPNVIAFASICRIEASPQGETNS